MEKALYKWILIIVIIIIDWNGLTSIERSEHGTKWPDNLQLESNHFNSYHLDLSVAQHLSSFVTQRLQNTASCFSSATSNLAFRLHNRLSPLRFTRYVELQRSPRFITVTFTKQRTKTTTAKQKELRNKNHYRAKHHWEIRTILKFRLLSHVIHNTLGNQIISRIQNVQTLCV